MLKNIEIKEICKKWCDCHTCFVKLPIVTIILVVTIIFLSGCSTQTAKDGWNLVTSPETYSVIMRPDGSIAYLIKTTED